MTAAARWGLATAREHGGERAYLVRDEHAVLIDDAARAVPHAEAVNAETLSSLLRTWNAAEEWLHAVAALDAEHWSSMSRPVHGLDLGAPVARTGKLLYAAANYRAHIIEQQRALNAGGTHQEVDKRSLRPYFFMKPASALSGPFDAIQIPTGVTQVDWEVELAFVIGKGGYRIRESRATEHIAGYLVANDITARDLVIRSDWPLLRTDWLAGKGFPSFAPLGPLLVPARFVPDPLALRLQLKVNGETKQDATARDMVFTPAEQIAFVSSVVPLEAGDVISTGTPEGVGFSSGVFLKSGDVVEAGIEGLGWQRNPVVEAKDASE